MRFKFTIFNRVNTGIVVPEPTGWDAAQFNISRDLETHGLMFDYGNDDYVWTGKAARLLQEEYNTYGAQGSMRLVVEEYCNGDPEILYEGKFVFSQFKRVVGDECSVRCLIEATGDIMTFRNRIDQKVNLETLVSYDNTTALPSYNGLGKTITLPSKGIYVENSAKNKTDNITEWMGYHTGGFPGGTIDTQHIAYFTPTQNKTIGSEIGGFSIPSDSTENHDEIIYSGWTYLTHQEWVSLPYYNALAPDYLKYFPIDLITPIVNYDKELGNEFGTIALTLEGTLDFVIDTNFVSGRPVASGVYSCNIYLGILKAGKDPKNATSWQWLSDTEANWGVVGYAIAGTTPYTASKTKSFNIPITLNAGDRIYFFYTLCYAKFNAHATDIAFTIIHYINSYFRLHGLSKLPDTQSKVFLINESISRAVEAITNDKIRAYSNYFGRTDSQPYIQEVDGEGSLACITNGKFIRRLEAFRPNQPAQINISVKEIFDGLRPIHNIGMGLEADPSRPNNMILRIEHWKYFYQNTIVLYCEDIGKYEIESKEQEYYSQFEFGYEKWESESFNGIDEFLTKRTYRTDLSEVNNTLKMLSSFILSGYALEITRRKGGDNSDDWRYDDDVFMVALKRKSGDFSVELGGITSAENIIDPDTIYNFRYSPLRIALKWLPEIMKSYRINNVANKITFTDGSGNYYAKGRHNTSFFQISNAVIKENQTINALLMNNTANGLTTLRPERVLFDYPINIKLFKQIKSNPYGLISYSNGFESGVGWIEKLIYNPVESIGKFTLIPKI